MFWDLRYYTIRFGPQFTWFTLVVSFGLVRCFNIYYPEKKERIRSIPKMSIFSPQFAYEINNNNAFQLSQSSTGDEIYLKSVQSVPVSSQTDSINSLLFLLPVLQTQKWFYGVENNEIGLNSIRGVLYPHFMLFFLISFSMILYKHGVEYTHITHLKKIYG